MTTGGIMQHSAPKRVFADPVLNGFAAPCRDDVAIISGRGPTTTIDREKSPNPFLRWTPQC